MEKLKIDEMTRSIDNISDAEFEQRFGMKKEEFRASQQNAGPNNTQKKRKLVRPEKSENKALENATNADPNKVKRFYMNPGENPDANKDFIQAAYENRRKRRDNTIASMGRRGSIGALGFLGAALDGYMSYKDSREEDPAGSKLVDLAKAGATAAGWVYASGIMWSLEGAKLAVGVGKELYADADRNYQAEKKQSLHISQDASGNSKGTLGGQLIDTQTAYTMRQRNEQVMRQHRIATETILGSEARQLHR